MLIYEDCLVDKMTYRIKIQVLLTVWSCVVFVIQADIEWLFFVASAPFLHVEIIIQQDNGF